MSSEEVLLELLDKAELYQAGHKAGMKEAIQTITDLYPQDLDGLESDFEKGLNHAIAVIARKLHK